MKPEELRTVFARNFRLQRKARGLTQKQLAEKIGVTAAQVSHIESQRSSPSFEVIFMSARVFNLSPAALLIPAEVPGMSKEVA
ncbi:helix-turn-helix domain protein [Planctopirus limnophila DSM 3776]|uniref:Helix-turn-helix domain protein n=1 Tax=Planctopirus limnophila (strain ATCC 43296 / DSM 3776 / IFAM 1008 / Mu 290) TaxID=521674 RepID=D5SMR5_PLAL2|nr:helix-turn-helix transcriptional regulator [Planctopirus limnophila]ADG67970.1 helix-turn-helix domain protein [Planctopirus limnophila DSM 3776]